MLLKRHRAQIVFAGIAFALIALFFGLWSHYNTHETIPTELALKNGTAFPAPRIIKSFQLQNAPTGTFFKNDQLNGHWTMMFFGFTHCAMLCPTTFSTLNQTYNKLVEANVSELPQVMFVSIDPERDSLTRIHQYVTSFNKNFKGATGTDDQLESLTNELNILFNKENKKVGEDYQIDHSGTVLLIDPQGHLAGIFSPPVVAETLAEDYQAIIKHARDVK